MKMLFQGRWEDRDDKIEVVNSQDGSLVDTVPNANRDDMTAAVDAAVKASRCAKKMPVHERIRVLNEAAQFVKDKQEDFARTITLEGIKTLYEARKEVERCAQTLRISAEEARRLNGETIAFDQMPGSEGRKGFYTLEPLGVIGAITPFNDPLNLVAHKVGPAIASGNTIIVKPDSRTPLSALKLAEAFCQAGLPEGILQVITGAGNVVGHTLVTDPRVRMISFTGGRETGETIMQQGGLKKFVMELGNNAPVIVMPDADLEAACDALISGAFWAAGQNCLHVQRIFIHEAVFSQICEKLVEATRKLNVGDKLDEQTDMGPMIDEKAAEKVEALVQDALAKGARCLVGGTRDGAYVQPTLLTDISSTARLNKEEVYGPVSLLYSFETLEEAITQANAAPFGLQAAIFTKSLEVAFQAASELEYGGVMVNDSTDYRIDAMPFGGPKGSGLGREGVRFAMQEMTEQKVVCFNL